MLITKIVLIGTNKEFGVSLREFCADHPRLELLSQQFELEKALGYVKAECPDLVLVDIGLDVEPHGDLLHSIRLCCEATKFCWLTVFDDKIYSKYAEELGFDGIISRINFARNIDTVVAELFSPKKS